MKGITIGLIVLGLFFTSPLRAECHVITANGSTQVICIQ